MKNNRRSLELSTPSSSGLFCAPNSQLLFLSPSLLVLCSLLLAPCSSAQAQQQRKVPQIGFLVTPSRSFFSARIEAFRQGLLDLGYVEGKNILIEYRYAEGKLDRLADLAAERIGLKVDLIVAS